MIQEIVEALAQSWSNFTGAFVQFVPRLVAAFIIFGGGFVVAVLARRSCGARSRGCSSTAWPREPERTRCSVSPICQALTCSSRRLSSGSSGWVSWSRPLTRCSSAPFRGWCISSFRSCPVPCWLCWWSHWDSWWATLSGVPRCLRRSTPGSQAPVCSAATLRLLVIAIAVVMALEQLGLATAVVLTAFAIAFGALMLGLAIAFGLGGRDAARQLLEQHMKAQQRRESDATPHL